MVKYRYKAVTANGGELKGTYIAATKADVIKMIRANQGYPVLVEEDDILASAKAGRQWSIRHKDYEIMCRQLAAMLGAGVPIIQSLNILRTQVHNKSLKAGLDQVYEDVQKGQMLSEAMKRKRKVFPDLLINMIESGELSGSLENVVDRMAYHYQREGKISNKITSAMVYPVILSVVAICVVIFLLTFVMPTFVQIFENSGVALPLPTRMLIGLSNALKQYWYLFILVIGGGISVFIRHIHTPNGRLWFDSMKFAIPVIKGLNEKIASTRFTRTLSTMLHSGIPLIQALENIERVIGNRLVSDGLKSVREEVQRGSDLAGPISRLNLFPPMVSSMIHVGEESGTLEEILRKTAEYYDTEVENDFDRVLALFEPIMILVMGVAIGFIVISMALPMFDMMKTV